ncbi:hypothetical protein [Rhizobium sp. SL42]|uniref:hypothetical protein n=1 Tax=Rhizobium sp. SL42 TaxID=2806346 RepID=UPI001F1C6B1F|nr:hypothetical protein [Rhizobium sp. SL42]UJW75942.1 hypothetical protein IM739_05450 [Rhizobium sp. SL42]
MGMRGCRPVLIEAADAVIATRWLRGTAIPAMRNISGTILGGDQIADDARRLEVLADNLMRKAQRKRSSHDFSALIDVDDAAAFTRAFELCRPAWPLRYQQAIARLSSAMQDGGQSKRRGRKTLGGSEVTARVSGSVILEERHRKRLAARLRNSAAWDRWLTEAQASGHTILTTDLPSPQI